MRPRDRASRSGRDAAAISLAASTRQLLTAPSISRASAAVALLAAASTSCSQVAQHVEQGHSRGPRNGVLPAVDVKGNEFGSHASFSVLAILPNSLRTITSVTSRRYPALPRMSSMRHDGFACPAGCLVDPR
jgi:hypothetical protein